VIWLALVLVAADDVPRSGPPLTLEQVETAPVEQLSEHQLDIELQRVAEPRRTWPAVVLLVCSAVMWASALGTAGGVAALKGDDGFGSAYLLFIAGQLAFQGLILGQIGGSLLPVLIAKRDRETERRNAVVQRLEEIRLGIETPRRRPEVVAELAALEEMRPGVALPISMLVAGSVVGAVAAPVWINWGNTRSLNVTDLAIALALSCTSVVLGGLGAYFTISYSHERSAIDARIEELQALPPLPEAVHFYWHF